MYKNIQCRKKKIKEFIPQPFQKEVANYVLEDFKNNILTKKFKYKGLLLYHKLGSGKTCTTILIQNEIEKLYSRNNLDSPHVYVFSVAPLRENFIQEYCQVCGDDPETLKKKYTFFTYNYTGIINKLPQNLNNSIIIIDEAHRVIRGKSNHSKTYSEIYDLIDNAKNSKVILLTGTPYKVIEDIPLLINLIKPNSFKFDFDYYDKDDFFELLTPKTITLEDENFENEIIGEILVPNSEAQFLKYFEGVISYFPGGEAKYYPKRINEPIIKVLMSKDQTEKYYKMIKWENKQFQPDEILKRTNKKEYKFRMGLWMVAKKKLLSRAMSNFLYPSELNIDGKMVEFNIRENIINFKFGEKSENSSESLYLSFSDEKNKNAVSLPDKLVKEGGWIYPELFEPKKLSRYYSSKFYTILKNIANNLDGKHAIYSILKTRSGVYLLQTLLKMCGISTLVFSGDLNDKTREEVLTKFNNINNLRGEKYKVLLLTEAAGEGLTFKDVKYVHIVESDGDLAKIEQVVGRFIRYKSHANLPEEEKYCKVFKYFSVPLLETLDIREKDIVGIDEILYKKSLIGQAQKDVFLKLMQQSSIN